MSRIALKREFDLDDESLEDLKTELIDAKWLTIDEDGKVLVWTGGEGTGESENRKPHPSTQHPISYTPPHLAERIRAVAMTATLPSKTWDPRRSKWKKESQRTT